MHNHLKTFLLFFLILSAGCGKTITPVELQQQPGIYPDYKDVTIPANIAPLNFSWEGNGPCRLKIDTGTDIYIIKGHRSLFRFPRCLWHKLMSAGKLEFTVLARKDGEWQAYEPFTITVSKELIDPVLSYRLIPPGYESYYEMGLYQRNLENYDQTPILENKLTDHNCLNCHSYCNRNPETLVFHSRNVFGGTVILKDGNIEKLNTKTDSTISALVYPYWHPSGRWVAFSVNDTWQDFHSTDRNRIEVYDKKSDVVIYDVEGHRISWSPLTKSEDRFETFPTFSPDGKWLYFCSAEAVENMPADYQKVKYALMRIAFDPESGRLGDKLETVFDAPFIGKSVSFPRISPDGRWLAFTLHGYGNFSIWHRDADIWMLDLQTGDAWPAEELNSEDVDSYHCWSSNGRWLVFSSRRDDGLYTRPYISYMDENGHACKPFMLPQKNPKEYYENLMFSYNIPELMTGSVKVPQKEFATTLRNSKGTDIGLR